MFVRLNSIILYGMILLSKLLTHDQGINMKKITLLLTTAILFMTACNETPDTKEPVKTEPTSQIEQIDKHTKKRQISKQELMSYAFQKYKVNFKSLKTEEKQRLMKEYIYLSKLTDALNTKGMKNDADLQVAKKLLTVSVWEKKALQKMSVSEENLQKMYKKHKPTIADRYKLSNVLVKTEKEAKTIQMKLEKIKSPKAKAEAFGNYVKTSSLDERSKAKQGNLGWMNMQDVSKPMQAIFKDKKEHDIILFHTNNDRWQVFLVTGYLEGRDATFEESKKNLIEMAKKRALSEKIKSLVH